MIDLSVSGPPRVYDPGMASDDPVVERAARAYRRILEAQQPGVVWMRASRRELEDLRRPVAPPLTGDVDGILVGPDEVGAAA